MDLLGVEAGIELLGAYADRLYCGCDAAGSPYTSRLGADVCEELGGGAIGACCDGVVLCDGGPCSVAFFRDGSSGSGSLSSESRFDFLGACAGFGGGALC